ncbi:MAG: DUF885 family protein [Saprospiraceae bacterium]
MFKLNRLLVALAGALLVMSCNDSSKNTADAPPIKTHAELTAFFQEWRAFQAPEMKDRLPDYSAAAMKQQHQALAQWQQRLARVDTSGWTIPQQVDWYLIWAEMNGLDFDHRVLQPWVRDPAFYVWFYPDPSDVPEREGPNIHGCVELPKYAQPLSAQDAAEIAGKFRNAKALYEQAKQNLTGNARDLWITGTRSIREQSEALEAFAEAVKASHADLAAAALEARDASNAFAQWLDSQASSKTGTSGIGKENYTWCLQKVHLLPYTWEEEVLLLERELARSHSALRLFEHRHRNLPKLSKISNEADFNRELNNAVTEYINFFRDAEVVTMKDYMDKALRDQIGAFRQVEGVRGFFDEIGYRDAIVMRTHHYHWIELERLRLEPYENVIRQTPLLYNIFDSRAEGLATAMEELMMNAGLLENRPRAKELIWILLAQRAARGLGSLYQHGLEMDYKAACEFASKWTPWGLLPADGGTIQHEEQFYLQQPVYGSSYVTGKLELDKLIAEYARQRKEQFVLKDFMDDLNRVGIIPTSLIYWELTGDKSLLLKAVGK